MSVQVVKMIEMLQEHLILITKSKNKIKTHNKFQIYILKSNQKVNPQTYPKFQTP